MAATIYFFPVGNGDMTLVKLESGRTILIDVKICGGADDPDDTTPDVATMLRDRLSVDSTGRTFVDAFLLSHPDEDHCAGLQNHFHLGPPSDWSKADNKIFVREIWSSPMVFRRASRLIRLVEDAQAFNAEARRRVQRFRDSGGQVADGDRILILGEDENGKTDDLTSILIKVDTVFSKISGQDDATISVRLLAPQPKSADEQDEDRRAKNHSSAILQMSIAGGGIPSKCQFLSGGDAEVAIWERLWQRNKGGTSGLSYNLLQAPHHCSWHSLSYDSWSDKRDEAVVCDDARNALSQALTGAIIVASCKPILDDDNDPPSFGAKTEYEKIADDASGEFKCTGSDSASEPLEFEVGEHGIRPKTKLLGAAALVGGGAVGRQPLPHG